METHEKKNEGRRDEDILEAGKLKAEEKREERNRSGKVNKLWLWLGVLLLIFILLWWLYSVGMFEDLIGVSNG